jgi:hypothetical protein
MKVICFVSNWNFTFSPVLEQCLYYCVRFVVIRLDCLKWVDVTFVRYEVFTAVTMKNAVFWDIKTQFVPHRKQHYVSASEPSWLMLCKI